jgi:hypothetical protein
MIIMAPIVYAMRYLQRTNGLTPQAENRAKFFMKVGKIFCTAASIMLPVNVIIEGMSSQDVLGNLTGPLHFKIGGVGGYGV